MAAPQPPTTSNSWVYSIRTSMANDPAKLWFETQVQTHGFDFLDDYLGNILAQAKPQPIIELVKTPGRKKNTSKKTKFVATASKLKSNATLFLDDNDDHVKENIAPANNTFHRALLDVKGSGNTSYHSGHEFRQTQSDSLSKPKIVDISSLRTHELELAEVPDTIHPLLPETSRAESLNLPPVNLEQKDLSVIAEGDEFTEQIQRSMPSTVPVKPPSSPRPVPRSLCEDTRSNDDVTSITVSITPPSARTVRAIIPDFFEAPSDPQTESVDHHTPLTAAIPSTTSLGLHSTTAPLPSQQPPVQAPSSTFKVTIPLHEIPGSGLMRKASAPQLQTFITNPSIVRDTPGSVASQSTLGKRTSWLSKAREPREVKVLETNLKRTSTLDQGGSAELISLALPAAAGRAKRKSTEMFDAVFEDSNTRQSKLLKVAENDTQSNSDHRSTTDETHSMPVSDETHRNGDMLEHLKRTVEGFGARKLKSMGKSLGGMAAAALAEARATAEARVAEKAKMDSDADPTSLATEISRAPKDEEVIEPAIVSADSTCSRDSEKRLSISELFVDRESSKGHERVFQPPTGPSGHTSNVTPDNISMVTDPVSPQKSRQSKSSLSLLSKPVFMKPPPKVFVAPSLSKPISPKMAATNLGLSPSFQRPVPLSAQSSAASIQSDRVFDNDNAPPVWMPTTQETEYTVVDYETQDQGMRGVNEMEEDDSWHDGDKIGELDHIWTALACAPTEKEDEMTWSTIPTQTHTSSTQNQSNSNKLHDPLPHATAEITGTVYADGIEDNAPHNEHEDDIVDDMDIDVELVDVELEPGQMTVNLVKKQVDTHPSIVSQLFSPSESLQERFQQASKFVTNVLSTSKNGKTPDQPKNIHSAAAAKQQKAEDKKAVILKEVDTLRQQVNQKEEHEKVRALEEERKAKDEVDKRKRERDEHTDKKSVKAHIMKKVNGEASGKRKAGPDTKMAQETKELQPARAAINNPPKSILKSTVEAPDQVQAVPKPAKVTIAEITVTKTTTPAKGKGKAVATPLDDPQPSRIVQGHMAARARAQMHPPPVKSESIQLPDIDSEYSDSDDEDRKKTFDPPDWAQSPNLHNALHSMSTVNPDNIFGAVQPLHIEDMFKSRHSRFRARTSSANWSGTDGLTREEEEEYVRRMGFN